VKVEQLLDVAQQLGDPLGHRCAPIMSNSTHSRIPSATATAIV